MRLRTDSFGLPWNIPQSMRTRARSVTSRNCEPVTVVAPPRKWICMARMVTARRRRARILPRIARSMASVVERSFGERSAGVRRPAWSRGLAASRRPGDGVDAALDRTLSRATARVRPRRSTACDGAGRRRRATAGRWPTCAPRSPGSTSSSRRPGPGRRRAARRSRTRRRRGRAAATTLPALRRGRGRGPRRRRDARSPDASSAASRPNRIPATPARAVRGAGTGLAGGRRRRRRREPVPRAPPRERRALGRATARRSRRTRWRSGSRPGRLEADAPRDPGRVARRAGPGAASSRGTTGTSSGRPRGASAGSSPRDRLLDRSTDALPGGARRRSGRARDRLRHPAAARAPADPGRVHARHGRGPDGPTAAWTPAAVGLRDVRGGRPRQPRASCSTRAATRSTRRRSGRARHSSNARRRRRGVPRGHGRHPRLGRG